MSYTENTLLSNAKNHGGNRSASSIKYLVYHFTANKTDKAENNAKYFHNNVVKASAHVFVDDTSVWHSVPYEQIAWSVGGSKYRNCSSTGGGSMYGKITNSNSISIEMCSTNGVITDATMRNAAAIGKAIMAKYNIPASNVYRHFDVTGKSCPGWTGWIGSNHSQWDKLKSYITGSAVQPSAPSASSSTPAGKPASSGNATIKNGQLAANKFTGKTITADGIRGANTRRQAIRVLQHAINLDYHKGLVEDGLWGPKTKAALGRHYVKRGEKQYMVTAAEILVSMLGRNPGGIEYPGVFGGGLQRAAGKSKITASDFISYLN